MTTIDSSWQFAELSGLPTERAFSKDRVLFLRAWARRPLSVASVTPSGSKLAALITAEISAETGPVLELGPGTGVFTRALLDRGVAEQDLTLVERDRHFQPLLAKQFPAACLLATDATRIPIEGPVFGASVSGLPLLSMPPRAVMKILTRVFQNQSEGAALYQFTYGPRCPVPRPILDRLGLKAVRIGATFRNLPPAAVYRITRRPACRLQEKAPV